MSAGFCQSRSRTGLSLASPKLELYEISSDRIGMPNRWTGNPPHFLFGNDEDRIRILFSGELHFRRGGADIGIDLRFELGEVLLEHADQRTRGLVELSLVGPGLDRIEDMRFEDRKSTRLNSSHLGIS